MSILGFFVYLILFDFLETLYKNEGIGKGYRQPIIKINRRLVN
jgi:hypothetical protein